MKITFICPIHNTFPEIVSSLINQTYENWQLLLIHDGVNTTNLKAFIDFIDDDRITYIESEEKRGNWGHYYRNWAIEEIDRLSPGTDCIVVTNADNYHVPVYCEYMIKPFSDDNVIASYCSHMTHNYCHWNVMECAIHFGSIDSAAVMIRKEASVSVGWRSMVEASDWVYFEDVINKYGVERWRKVNGNLLVHN